jgi:flagellar hook protein FlgE
MGFPTDPTTGKAAGALLQPLVIPTAGPIAAKATERVTAEFNLDARARDAAGVAAVTGPPAIPAIPATPRSTYGTSINVYDAQGVAAPLQLYFQKTATANEWTVHTGLNTVSPPVTFASIGTLRFDATGKLTLPATGTLNIGVNTIDSPNPNSTTPGKLPQALTVDLSKITHFGSAFAVSNLSQDGYASGEMTGLTIGENGTIATRYSNGQTQYSGQIALADFRNTQGLSPLGGNAWAATFESGDSVSGAPGAGKFGALRAGALEDSNVDLTSELVNMMTAQRAYQANAQTIKTQDQVMSTLVNLR